MSTIPDNPFNASKPETAPAVPTTADQRAQHAAGNAAFAAAKTDVEALEAGKEDVGVADSAVSAHNASGSAHPGTFDPAGSASAVQGNLDAHIGTGGAAHAAATTLAAGFLAAADKIKLDGIDAGANNYSHPNHTGDVTSVGDGAQTIAAGAVTNAKLADMAAETVKLRQTTTGSPQDVRLDALPAGGTPASADAIFGQKSGGALVQFSADDFGGGGSGTLTTVRKNSGVDVSTGRARLNFIEGANVTIDIVDDAPGDEADITITATPSGGGGGDMLSPATIAVGELYSAADTSGVQTQRTNILTVNLPTQAAPASAAGEIIASAGNDKTQQASGLAVTAVSTHIGSTSNPHSVMHAQTSPPAAEHVGAGTAGAGLTHTAGTLDVGAGLGITVAADSVAVNEAALTHNNIGGLATAGAHPTSAITGLDATLASKLENVVEDTSPQLGGDLDSNNFSITLSESSSTQGFLGAASTFAGSVLAYYDGVNAWEDTEGAVAVTPQGVGLFGSTVGVNSLVHEVEGGRQVYVSEDGLLYGVDPPPVGWTLSALDTGDHNLGEGDTPQPWVPITNLNVTTGQDIDDQQRLDLSVSLYVVHGKSGDVNDPMDKTGSVDIGFQVGGGAIVEGGKASISPYFAGWVTVAFSTIASGAISSGTVIQIHARNGGGEDGASNPFAQYSSPGPGTGDGHEFVLSTPGGSTGGGGDVTKGSPVATGELAVWQDAGAASLLNASPGLTPAVVVRSDQSSGIDIAYNATTAAAVSGTWQPDFTDARYRTANGALTVEHNGPGVNNAGAMLVRVPATFAVAAGTDCVLHGTDPGTGQDRTIAVIRIPGDSKTHVYFGAAEV